MLQSRVISVSPVNGFMSSLFFKPTQVHTLALKTVVTTGFTIFCGVKRGKTLPLKRTKLQN